MANYFELEWVEKNPQIVARINRALSPLPPSINPSDLFSNPITITPYVSTGNFISIKAQIPMMDDVSIELKSNFAKASEVLGQFSSGVAGFINFAKNLTSAVGGQTSAFFNKFDLLVWQETEPIKCDFDAIFYTRHNPMKDVAIPAMSLCNMTVLSSVPSSGGNQAIVPGVSLSTLNNFKTAFAAPSAPVAEGFPDSPAKLLGFRIPGIIDFGQCVLEQAKPTFSKEITESGLPLWIKVTCTVRTTMPAFDEMLFAELLKPGIEVGTFTNAASAAIQVFR